MAAQNSVQTYSILPSNKYGRPPPLSKILLHELDPVAAPIHIRNHRFYRRPSNTNTTDVIDRLKSSLSEALELYAPVTGTVRGNEKGEVYIAMDAENIQATPFLVDVKDTPYTGDSESLSPRTEVLLPSGSPNLAVKVTLFSCGILALASSMNHQITDLRGFLDFLELWAQIARDDPVDLTKIPIDWTHTPSRFFPGLTGKSIVPIPPPGFKVLETPTTTPLAFLLAPSEVTRWILTESSVKQLKNDFSPSSFVSHPKAWISSGDAVAALVCGAITRARENARVARLDGRSSIESQVEKFMMAADGRERSPGGKMLDGQYFGNFNPLFETVVPRSDLLSLSNESASRISLAIRDALNAQLSPEALADKIAFLENPKNTQPPGRIVWTADIVATNWCRFDIQGPKLDFGWGKPFLATQGGGSVYPPGYVMLTQDKTSGDITVLMTIEKDGIDGLKADILMNKYATLVTT